METTAISLIPPLIVILLVIATRRVIISISAGIIASALILCGFRPGDAVEAVMGSAARIFYTEGNWDFDNMLLVLFILGLGMLTAFIDKKRRDHRFCKMGTETGKERGYGPASGGCAGNHHIHR